jgi:antitoxin component YwqK of YwqJK toxin-antitoxin module
MKIFIILFSALVLGHGNILFALSKSLSVERVVFQDDPLNGPKKRYYPNGKIMNEYSFKYGKLDGSYKIYNELGHLVSDQNFKNGLPNGNFRTYYENGQLRSESNLKDGQLDGPSKEYYENGNLKQESNLTGEPFQQSGKTILNYENGKLWQEITTSEGKLVYSITYDQEGRVTFEEKPGQSISYYYDLDGTRHVSINGVEQK